MSRESYKYHLIVKYHGKVMVSGEETVCFIIYCNVTVVLRDYYHNYVPNMILEHKNSL